MQNCIGKTNDCSGVTHIGLPRSTRSFDKLRMTDRTKGRVAGSGFLLRRNDGNSGQSGNKKSSVDYHEAFNIFLCGIQKLQINGAYIKVTTLLLRS